MVHKANQYLEPASYQYIADDTAVEGHLKGDQRSRWQELKDGLKMFASLKPADLPIGTGITDVAPAPPETRVLRRGVYDAPKEEVQPGFLQILDPKPAKITPSKGTRSSGRRIAFANILADPNNPLTARVMVNRIWQFHFGRGIVGTPSDFGVKGDRPSHPALLDWLATEFVRNGWSIKKMHRLIMTSNTYRQSSRFEERAAKADPEDKLLWRFPRQRLEGEEVRDAALAVSGLLNLKMGGPSIFPELPPGMSPTYSGWKVSKEETERNRRSIYVFVKRNTRYPLFESFDMPDTHESCPRRNVTTTPLQALNLLNSELTLKWAEGFAARVIRSAGCDLDKQVDTAYRIAFARRPDNAERDTVRKFFDRHREIISVPIEEFPHGVSFGIVRAARESDAVSSVDLFVEVASGRPDDPRSEPLRPFQGQFAVQQIERLQRRGSDVAARTALVGVRHIEAFKQRIACVPLHEHVNAPPIALGFLFADFPAAVSRRHARRQFGKNAGAAHLQVQQTGHGERRVANFLAFEPLAGETPE